MGISLVLRWNRTDEISIDKDNKRLLMKVNFKLWKLLLIENVVYIINFLNLINLTHIIIIFNQDLI